MTTKSTKLYSFHVQDRAEQIVFSEHRPFIVGLASDNGEISEEDWQLYQAMSKEYPDGKISVWR